MKITYLHQYFNSPEMPGSTRSYEMARRLVEMGHEVNMITSWRALDGCTRWFETYECGIKVHWLPVPYSNRMDFKDRLLAFFKFAFRSSLKASSLDSDLVFASSTPLTIAIPAVYAAFCLKVPMVFEVRDLWPEMPIAMGAITNPLLMWASRLFEKWAYRHSSSVVALSPGMKEGVVRAGYPSCQVAVVPNSCDNDLFAYDHIAAQRFRAERPWLGDRPLLVYAGTFGRVNGVCYAVSLAKELLTLGSNVCILLVGDGIEYDLIERKAAEFCVLGKNLFVEQQVVKSGIYALFSAATASSNLVIDLPEARANSANKFFDTLAAGKPIFLNHGGWMHELVIKYRCGISAWGRPLDDVARELDSRLNDLEWLSSTRRNSRILAENFFDRDDLARQLESVLIAASKGKSYMAESVAPGIY